MDESSDQPLLIAHRFGNHLDRLRAVRPLRPDLIETDIHHYYGRLEVRHAKTLGPIPFLWDRKPWRIFNPFARRLKLADVYSALQPGEELMLDLKRPGRRMARGIVETVERLRPSERTTICSRSWKVLSVFADRPWARVVYSAGSPAQIDGLWRHIDAAEGASIDHNLLTPELVGRLREQLPLLMAWTVNDPERWRELASWGVNGVITDVPEVMAPLLRGDSPPG